MFPVMSAMKTLTENPVHVMCSEVEGIHHSDLIFSIEAQFLFKV